MIHAHAKGNNLDGALEWVAALQAAYPDSSQFVSPFEDLWLVQMTMGNTVEEVDKAYYLVRSGRAVGGGTHGRLVDGRGWCLARCLLGGVLAVDAGSGGLSCLRSGVVRALVSWLATWCCTGFWCCGFPWLGPTCDALAAHYL